MRAGALVGGRHIWAYASVSGLFVFKKRGVWVYEVSRSIQRLTAAERTGAAFIVNERRKSIFKNNVINGIHVDIFFKNLRQLFKSVLHRKVFFRSIGYVFLCRQIFH